MVNSRNPRFNHQSEQASESALVDRNVDETDKRPGGAGELPITLTLPNENSLSAEMLSLYESQLPTKESYEKRKAFAKKIEMILNEEWPGNDIKVHMFGSSMNELGTTQSDVDLCVTTQWNGLKNIYLLSNCLHRHGMKIEQIVSKAKVPIVRLLDPKSDLSCDINVNNTLALHNTRLIRKYVSIDPRVRPLAMIVKYWARRRVLNDAAKGGTISTYTWTCIILNFLQMRDPPILPVLHKIPHDDVDPIIVNGEDASFYENVETLEKFGEPNKESIGGLLFAFFRRMAFEFDYDNHVISLRQGKYLTKAEKGWDTCKGWKMLCVEEPFNTARNLGNSADDVSVNGLKQEFRRAYDILYESACLDQLCEEFRFPQYNNFHYYPTTRYYNKRTSKQRPLNKTGGTWKPGNRKPWNSCTKYYQNGHGQTNYLENFHDMNVKSNYSQDNDENGSSMLRFHPDNSSSRQIDHYSVVNDSEEFITEPINVDRTKCTDGYYENTDISKFSSYPARKQFDNIQSRHGLSQTTRHVEVDNFQHNVLKEDEHQPYSSQNSHFKSNNSYRQPRRRNDIYTSSTRFVNVDQSNSYPRTSQSQDSGSAYKPNQEIEFEGHTRQADIIPNQSQHFYKNGNQKSDINFQKNARPSYTMRFQHSSDQKSNYSQNTNGSYDSDRFNNNFSRHPTTPNDSDQKSSGFCDSDKRNYYKHYKPPYLNKQDANLRQVEDLNSNSIIPNIVDDSHSNFDRSNPVQISSPKSGHKPNNRNRNFKQRQFQKLTENVDLTNPYGYRNGDNSMLPSDNGHVQTYSNHSNGYLPLQVYTSSQQNHCGQSNDGSTNYQRRMSHQSSSDGSNSQTSGNTSNTSYSNSSNNSSYTKNVNNHQKNNNGNQNNNYHQQQNQYKSNYNGLHGRKRKYSNNYTNGNNYNNYGSGRLNNTSNSSSTNDLNSNGSVFNYDETWIYNTSSQINQGHYSIPRDYNGNSDTNGYKVHGSNGGYNNNFKSYDNHNNSNSNSWKNSNGYNAIGSKTINGNNNNTNVNGPKLTNSNNFSNRNVNGSNSNYSRSNNNYPKNQNNNNNSNSHKSINGNNQNFQKSDGNNNSNAQMKNVNNNNYPNSIKSGGNNNNNGSTNSQRNNQIKKNNRGSKNIRRNSSAVKTERKEDNVNYQQQCSQESSLQERQIHQKKFVHQNGQSNNGKGKGGQKKLQ